MLFINRKGNVAKSLRLALGACIIQAEYPVRFLAGQIYRNRDNLAYCKQHVIRLSDTAFGRPRKDCDKNKRQAYLDKCERVEVKRYFSLAKRKCDMDLVSAKLRETTEHVIAMSMLVLNLHRIQHALLQLWVVLLSWSVLREKLAVVQ